MNKRFHQLPIFVLLLLALAAIYWKKSPSHHLAADALKRSAPVPLEAILETQEAAQPPAAADKPVAEVDAVEYETFAHLVAAIDPMRPQDFKKVDKALRLYPAEQVTRLMLRELKAIGADRPFERDRLIMLANDRQSASDLPFWTDLLLRQTPRYSNEERFRNPKHPTLESRSIDLEQLQAIRNIGLIARDEKQAQHVLADLILSPDPGAHRTLHREQAYIALKESNLAASLRVLKQLPAYDDLLKRL